MDSTIAAILVQDGIVNGAIYALLALSLVLVFAVTRVVFVPQGEFVAYGALTYAALDSGILPGSLWLLGGLGAAAFLFGLRQRRAIFRMALTCLALPAAVIGLTWLLLPHKPGMLVNALLTLAIVTPVAPYIYRIGFQPLAEASVLVLLIAAVAVHLALMGLGLVFFGPEGSRAAAFSSVSIGVGDFTLSGQALWILGLTGALMIALYLFFGFTLLGKALRATAVNRLGARLVGIGTAQSGSLAFVLAGAIGTLSGILIVPLTTVYYDSGFVIGLKAFTAAIIAAMASFPGAVLAALLVGVLESFASFWASAFKEVIVFTAIIPVLLWRSLRHAAVEDEEE
jgi:branched-chain amino acid transport system permease protein